VGRQGKSQVLGCGSDAHGALDVGGLINPIADFFNGLIYLCEGDLPGAAISGLSIIPIGDFLKLLRRALKAGEASSVAQRLSHLGPDVVRQVDEAIERAASGRPPRFQGHDGKIFENTLGRLPQALPGYYSEWTAAASGAKRGENRVIIGGDRAAPDTIWYWDHKTNLIQLCP
jgi:hypothetical protein